MKLVIDSTVPFIEGVFEPWATVVYKPGNEICHLDVIDADALIISNMCRVNETLLDNTLVKMIAVNTVGMDRVDQAYCADRGIFVQNASASNSGALCNYVFSALYGCASRKSIDLKGKTIGIIGGGPAGQRVEMTGRTLGFNILMRDPVREAAEGSTHFCSLDYLLENSDIVTLHGPLNDSTKGMCDASVFEKMRFGAFFINTARGEPVDEKALLQAIPKLGPVIIDTWNNEPYINQALLEKVDIATPHIAGFSYQGKLNGTRAAVRSVARFFGITELYDFFPKPDIDNMEACHVDVAGMSQGQIASTFQYNYPIFTDDFMLRMDPDNFAKLRQEYRYRREFYVN